jgi:hypothetical protein
MIEGKVLGKGLLYIKALDSTVDITEVLGYSYLEFRDFLGWCNEKELDSLLNKAEDKGYLTRTFQIQCVLNNC